MHKHIILVNNYSHRDVLAYKIKKELPYSQLDIYPSGFRLKTNGLMIHCVIILDEKSITSVRGLRSHTLSLLFEPTSVEFKKWVETINHLYMFKDELIMYDDSFIDNLMKRVWNYE